MIITNLNERTEKVIIPTKEVRSMAVATFSVRMDADLKEEFDALCDEFGMSMSTAINIFARAVVRQRKIPFDIASSLEDPVRGQALKAFLEMREEAKKNGTSGMSLEEINAEIDLARQGK